MPNLTRQQMQGFRAEADLEKHLEDLGWLPNRIQRDTGEDFIVQVLDNLVTTNLSFYIQCKSVSDPEARRISGGKLSYSLEVKDLIEWDASNPPVLIVIWDMQAHNGYWVWAADAVRDLDKKRPKWRCQSTTHVHVSQSNKLDDDGIRRIRQAVAEFAYPAIARGRMLKGSIKLRFSRSEDGNARREAWERFFAHGDRAVIDGRFIDEIRFSDWWERLFGKIDMSQGRLEVGPSPSTHVHPVEFGFSSTAGRKVSIPYVALKTTKGGHDSETLTNEEQDYPILFTLILHHATLEWHLAWKLREPGPDVCTAREALAFLQSLGNGGTLHIRFHELVITKSTWVSPQSLPEWIKIEMPILDTLCSLQEKTGCQLTLPSDWALPPSDLHIIGLLSQIVRDGTIMQENRTGHVQGERAYLQMLLGHVRDGEPAATTIEDSESFVRILGKDVDLGPKTIHIAGELGIPVDEFEKRLQSLEVGERGEVPIINATVVEEYHNWMPPEEDHSVG